MQRAILIAGFICAALSPAWGDGLAPVVPRATGDPHPEGNAYMRRWHMAMMRHDRDLTMYDGARPVHASIGACFECHAVLDAAGDPVTVADDRHFCRVCHDFAAVKVDCFDCHRSTPEDFEEPPAQASAGPMISLPAPADLAALQHYLDQKPEATR